MGSNTESIEDLYDTMNELKLTSKKLLEDNKTYENEINNNNKDIEDANLQIEKIMKDLILNGGFQKDTMIELKILNEIINNSDEKYSEHKNAIYKCIDMLINFSNQYLEIYKNQEEETEDIEENKEDTLLKMTKDELIDLCKEYDLPCTGTKKKLAERIINYLN